MILILWAFFINFYNLPTFFACLTIFLTLKSPFRAKCAPKFLVQLSIGAKCPLKILVQRQICAEHVDESLYFFQLSAEFSGVQKN